MTAFDERADTLRELPLRPGYWLARRNLRTPAVPAAIWWREHEPDDPGNVMDRGHWAAAFAGAECDPFEVMACKDRQPIGEAEYRFRMSERRWAEEFAPEDVAAAHPRRPIDLTRIEAIEP